MVATGGTALPGKSLKSGSVQPRGGPEGQNEEVPSFLLQMSEKIFPGPPRAPNLQRLN